MESRDRSDIVLHCFDPLGREIVGRRGRWEAHIHVRHPEIDGHFDAVRGTLERPEIIAIDAVHPERRTYYQRGALPSPYDPLYLKVCVGFYQRGPLGIVGTIITAYPTTRVGNGETREWP